MVRLAPLLIGFGLAAGKTIDIETTSTPTIGGGRTSKALDTLQSSKQLKTLSYPTNVLPSLSPVKRRQGDVRFPQQHHHPVDSLPQQKQLRPYSGVSTASPQTPTVNRDSSGYQQQGGSSYPQSGYSYQPSGYDSYDGSGSSYAHYNSVSSGQGGGNFLQEIGRYGAVLVPILLVIGALFLLPSVVNVGTTTRRRRRQADESSRPEDSDDLIYRLRRIYTSISEEPACVSRMYCEVGAVVGSTPYTHQVLRMVETFFPRDQNANMRVLEKAAFSDDPKCHLLQCAAWDEQPANKE